MFRPWFISLVSIMTGLSGTSIAQDIHFMPRASGGGGANFMKVSSFVDQRYTGVERQAYDISCGAAAVSTLLRHYFNKDISEQDIIDDILAHSTEDQQASINKFGFSLLELKRAGERSGLVAGGFKLKSVDRLEKLNAPAIALTTVRGYAHFVVIRGAENGKVFIADPAFGNRTRTIKEFENEWDMILLTMIDPAEGETLAEFTTDHGLYARADTIINVLDHGLEPIRAQPGEFFR